MLRATDLQITSFILKLIIKSLHFSHLSTCGHSPWKITFVPGRVVSWSISFNSCITSFESGSWMISQLCRNVLIVILHKFFQIIEKAFICRSDKSSCHSFSSSSTSSSNSMGVVDNIAWGMEVNNMVHSFNIKTTSCNIRTD